MRQGTDRNVQTDAAAEEEEKAIEDTAEQKANPKPDDADDGIMMITAMEGEVPASLLADPGIQEVKLSVTDGKLSLDHEVLAVQCGVGSNANGERTPAFLIKVKPGPISGCTSHSGDSILGAGSFNVSYRNKTGNVMASLSLGNHFMTAEDFTKGYKGGKDAVASDGTVMALEGFSSTDLSDGIKTASIFEPGLGSISVYLNYAYQTERLNTADELIEMIKPHMEDFKSRFEVVSEWDEQDRSPQSYIQLDTDYFSYNVNSQDKLKLDFDIAVSSALDELSNDFVKIDFKQADKSLKLQLEPEGDGSGFTTEQVKSGLDFVFGGGALTLK